MNNKGQIIITDLLLYLILTTIILSLIIFSMVTLDDNQVTRINIKQLNDLTGDCLDMLTKTSGTPNNWEHADYNEIKTIGLKSNDNHLISYDKLIKLKNNNRLLEKYFPEGVSYELTLYPKNNQNDKMIIAQKSFSNKKQTVSKSEVILLDYGFEITSFTNDKNNEYCYYNHDNNWTCKSFPISRKSLNEGKYYIVTKSNIRYILSNTYSENVTGTSHSTLSINDKLNQLLKNENETVYLHICTGDNNTHMVYDKNNREEFLKYVIDPEVYSLNIKVAI